MPTRHFLALHFSHFWGLHASTKPTNDSMAEAGFTTAWTKQCSLGWVVEAGFTTAWTKLKLHGLVMSRCSIMGGLVKVSFTTAWTKQCSQLHGLNLNCMD